VTITVLLVLATIANTLLLAAILRETRRRRLPGQPVAGSSRGQPVPAAAGLKVADLPARVRTAEEQAEYDAVELNRITAKLTKEYPNMGATKRETVAKEIMLKARGLLARTP
jgi:hypothetical protein